MKILLLAILSPPLSLFAGGALGIPDQPYIYVHGRGEIEKPAEIVTVQFSLIARDADQAKANQQVQFNAAKVFEMLDSRKISQADVVAEDLNSAAEFGENENSSQNRGKVIGYRVTRPFAVKLRETALLPKLVNDLLAIPGTEFAGVEAGLVDEKAVRKAASEKALADAREQAERTLDATGMKIDSVFALSPVVFPDIPMRIFFGGDRNATLGAAGREAMIPPPTEYRLPPIRVTQSIHVIYLISPKKP